MEPKDLKNSEELKSPKKTDLENAEKKIVSEKNENVEETSQAEKEQPAVSAIETPGKEEGATINADVIEAVAETREATPALEELVEEEKTGQPVETAPVEEPKNEEETPETTDEKMENAALVEAEEKTGATEVVLTEEENAGGAAKTPPAEKPEKEKETPGAVVENPEKNSEPTEVAAKPERKIIHEKREIVDYSEYTQIELVNALRDVLDSSEDRNIKDEVEIIKSQFYKNSNEKIETAKKKFIEEGGEEDSFVAEVDPYENDIKDLLRRYRQIRFEYSKKMEVEKEENLKLKYDVIERIKGLINNEESINKTFNEFRDLQHEWREIGLVPQSKMKNLWDTYHFHVENFYDYIKINRELRDLDLRKNLEIKIKLCENAEELLVEPSIIKAFNTLQKYHEQWREVGPVPREQKDDIWERFKAATSKINKKHQEFFEARKEEQKKNLEAKIALCEKVEEIDTSNIPNYREWDEKSKELVKLQKVWRTIGFAPKKDNNKIYERFRKACDKFFDTKREFYAKNKELQQNNLQLKIDLCVQAESLKDSTDWKKTTQDLINIQKKWKEIGPIPRKHSDNIWKRFRSACDQFFEKKSEHFSGMDSEQTENLKRKEELIEKVVNFKSTGDVDQNLKSLREYQREWTEIGHVPFKKKDEIQIRFRDAINKLFDELNIDESKRNLLKFRSKMTSYSESNRGQNKMRMERDKYMNKLKQLENDLVLLDNNIGFFAKSKNAESLIADVNKKIEMSKQKIEFLKQKIRVIDEMDNE